MTAVEKVGKALAAMVAAGVGSAALGVLTTLAELSPGLKNILNFYDPVGPLSGKTTVAVIIWLIAWYALAKIAETADRTIWDATHGMIAGHAIKHLLASMACAAALWPLIAPRSATRSG